MVFPVESCATLRLLRCGVKRKTRSNADFGPFQPVHHEQMAWILPHRKAADPYGAGAGAGTK
jgi:hypothetical protein